MRELDPDKMSYEARFMNSVLDASLDGIFIAEALRGPEGRIMDLLIKKTNPAFTRIRKIEAADAVGKKYLSLFPSAKDLGMFDLFCRVLDSGRPGHGEFHYSGSDLEAWFEIAATRLDRDLLFVTFHDFTHVKRLQLQLEQKITELETLNTNLESFVFATSHDLIEPLRKSLLFLNRLKEEYTAALSPGGLGYVGRVEAGIERMRKLVHDLHVYSLIHAKPSEPQLVDLNKVVREVVADLELHFIEKKATIDLDDLPAVKGSRRQLHRLFQSLMENSLQFSLKDKPVAIRLSVRKIRGKDASFPLPSDAWKHPYYEFRLQDNGIGFDPAYADRIFTVFQRLHSGYSGAGLGLFLARKVVQNHQGWIHASSQAGVGTHIIWVLPVP